MSMNENRHESMTTFGRLLALALLTGSISTLTACHTVEGAGKDIQDAGQAVEDAADDNDATDNDHD
jgi:predicted small secreted protein